MPKKLKPLSTANATAAVLAARLPMLWSMGVNPTMAHQAEVRRMVSEKLAAVSEGAMAASMQASLEWFNAFTRTSWSPQAAAGRITSAALAPADKTVKANARRLKRR